jgi:hypothetical protein
VCNEEGKLQGLPFNFFCRGDAIVGPVFFVAGDQKGEFISLDPLVIEKLKDRFDLAA